MIFPAPKAIIKRLNLSTASKSRSIDINHEPIKVIKNVIKSEESLHSIRIKHFIRQCKSIVMNV